MVIFIPEKLKELVDGWLLQTNRNQESGGMFFGTDTEFKSFLPIPNFSQTPDRSFNMGNSKLYITEFSKMIGQMPIAGMHTHPNGSIPSEGDCKYIQHPNTPRYEIVITDTGKEFQWFCFDKQLKHAQIYFKDIELEKAVYSLSQSFGLMDLGRVMITPKSELICENDKGKQFLTFDSDTYAVWKWLEEHKNDWRNKTKVQIHKDTGLSTNKINEALKKLGVNKL